MRYDSNVISYSTACESASASPMVFRQPTAGPELELVHHYCQNLLTGTVGQSVSIFLEPKLDSGFPDVVAVFWNPEVASQWPEQRRHLLPEDLLITHHVNIAGKLPVEFLVKRFGTRRASEMMLRLSDAEIVQVRSEELTRKSLDEVYAVNRLVAIEAKVKDWRKGLEQAVQNTWFASESYLLLGVLPQKAGMAEYAQQLGVGVIQKEQSLQTPYLKSTVGKLPVSHASWFFNEWAWRYADL